MQFECTGAAFVRLCTACWVATPVPTIPTGRLRASVRDAGQVKARTARLSTSGAITDRMSNCRHGGWCTSGFLGTSLRLSDRSTGTLLSASAEKQMCFVFGGAPVRLRSALQEAAVEGLIVARTALQRLKHADEFSDSDEIEQVLIHLNAIEAYLMIALMIGWQALDEDELLGLQERIAPVRPHADSARST